MLPGSMEWLVIFGVALLIFGPKNLPRLAAAIGESVREFKKGLDPQASKTESKAIAEESEDKSKPTHS